MGSAFNTRYYEAVGGVALRSVGGVATQLIMIRRRRVRLRIRALARCPYIQSEGLPTFMSMESVSF